jgi:nucleoside-diphosphate-sugar epimerase
VGIAVESTLVGGGHEIVGFDAADGADVRDTAAVAAAIRGCHAVVHLAALLTEPGADSAALMTVNLIGTWNVLQAAEAAGVDRVIYMSSVNALGVFMGEASPDYFPIDDKHPCRPGRPYGISKLLSEEMCELFTTRTGVATICLRPPAVFDDELVDTITAARRRDAEFEWTPYWEYGCFIHADDLAGAVACALRCSDPGHVRLLVNADDISSADATSRELAGRLEPEVAWRGGPEYDADPYRALIDAGRARELLGWRPRVRWRSAGG